MFGYKGFLLFVTLCAFNQQVFCKPLKSDLNEGRGIGTTIWGWVTYPFYWWSSEPELPPTNSPLIGVGTTTLGPYDDVEVGKRNVTVWCNQHTCTTMKCTNDGCSNITCNIYDTYLNGECRVYNTVVAPEEPTTQITQVTEEATIASVIESTSETNHKDEQKPEERPLELEVVMSSTVPEGTDKLTNQEKDNSSSPQNKISP